MCYDKATETAAQAAERRTAAAEQRRTAAAPKKAAPGRAARALVAKGVTPRASCASSARGVSEWSKAIIQNSRFVPSEGAAPDLDGAQTAPRGLAEGEERRAEKGAPQAENEASEQGRQKPGQAGRKYQAPESDGTKREFCKPVMPPPSRSELGGRRHRAANCCPPRVCAAVRNERARAQHSGEGVTPLASSRRRRSGGTTYTEFFSKGLDKRP